MAFNSLQYAAFLPLALLAYWATPTRWRTAVLLVASYAFYGSWAWRFLLLLWFTTLVDYTVARRIEASDDDRRRRRLLFVTLGANLGALAYFKYAGFFVREATTMLGRVGWGSDPVLLEILLPVGISFFTFQSIGYVVDVFRRQQPAEPSLVTFATFVAFFPQLVAGPISRGHDLLPQLRGDRPRPTGDAALSGVLLIVRGLVKKVVIADSLAPLVAPAYTGSGFGSATALIAILAFAGQIYADFSAYTDIARGSARLFGIELVVNFRQPYLSRNVTEFWRRWHISLSTWLRDYLYIPLGGNRRGEWTTARNLFLTMVLGGFWHGASWTFLVWGALHGIALVIDHARKVVADTSHRLPTLRQAPAVVATFAFVAAAWVFFRAGSFSQAVDVFAGLFDPGGTAPAAGHVTLAVVLLGALLASDFVERGVQHPLRTVRARPGLTGLALGASFAAVLVCSGGAPTPFIYFQF